MEKLTVKNFGSIDNADILFGDLTIFAGPNGSGKGIFLQLIKLLADKNHIERTLEQYGFVWGNGTNANLDQLQNAVYYAHQRIFDMGLPITADASLCRCLQTETGEYKKGN